MSQFPDPIAVPKQVINKRKERVRQLTTSSLIGISIRFAIILGELVGVVWLGSAALMMDALHSLIDVISSIVLIVCIKVAARPPDENHPFGHGRFEPLVGFQLGLFMALIGGAMFIQQTFALSNIPEGVIVNPYVWIFPLFAMILLEICYQIVIYVAKKQQSPALAADAIHYRLDAITSLLAAIALIAGVFTPEWSVGIDHLGAILIALLMIGMGSYALWINLHQILDRVPDEHYFEKVSQAAKLVDGVKGTEKIRIQVCGPDAHVDIDVEVDPLLSVEKAHRISQKVRAEIQKEWPLVQDVTVHIEPYYPDDH